MYIDPLTGSTMFREFIGTVPREQRVPRVSERVRAYSDRKNAAAVPHHKVNRTDINEKPPTSLRHVVSPGVGRLMVAKCLRKQERVNGEPGIKAHKTMLTWSSVVKAKKRSSIACPSWALFEAHQPRRLTRTH